MLKSNVMGVAGMIVSMNGSLKPKVKHYSGPEIQ